MINQITYSGVITRLNNFVLIILFLLCLGCSKQEQSYFPLSEGFKWEYDVSLETKDGVVNQKYILNNLGEGELEGLPVFIRKSLNGVILYYANSTEGIHYLGSENSLSIKPEFIEDKQLVIPGKLSTEVIWEQPTVTRLLKKTGPPQKTVFEIFAKVLMEAKIESLNEVINVPAGQFNNCMKITMTGSSFKDAGNYVGLTLVNVEQTSWYAPGVGLIKMERVETTKSDALDRGTLLIELAEYESG